jgi:hypothetical protein
MNKENHQDVDYIEGQSNFQMAVNDPSFRKAVQLDKELFEVESKKSSINLNLPIQLGYFILQYAKLRMLEFYYDSVDNYVFYNMSYSHL